MRVYIASPFFNKQQIALVKKIEKTLDKAKIPYFSPRSEGTLMDMAPEEQAACRKQVFESNIANMEDCSHMIANLVYKDSGTIFEMGWFYAAMKPITILHLTPSTINVMLAESAYTICDYVSKLPKSLRGEYSVDIGSVE